MFLMRQLTGGTKDWLLPLCLHVCMRD